MTSKTFLHGILIFMSLLLLSIAATAQTLPSVNADKINQILDTYVAEGFPGISIAIYQNQIPLWKSAVGYADVDTRETLTPEYQLRIGSVTKIFTSVVVLQLAQENRLSLDDSVEKWLPGKVIEGNKITIRNLLNMTSGLFNYTNSAEMWDRFEQDPMHEWVFEEFAQFFNPVGLQFAPGSAYQYSNSNYVILGEIIKTVTGRSPESEIESRIVAPLGLKKTVFGSLPTVSSLFAHGHRDWDEDGSLEVFYKYNMSWGSTAGNGVSTPSELCVFMNALVSGQLLSESSMNAMQEFVSNPTGSNDQVRGFYGCGLVKMEIDSSVYGIPLTALGHEGAITSYRSSLFHVPERALTIALITNLDEGTEQGRLTSIFFKTLKVLLETTSHVDGWDGMR